MTLQAVRCVKCDGTGQLADWYDELQTGQPVDKAGGELVYRDCPRCDGIGYVAIEIEKLKRIP